MSRRHLLARIIFVICSAVFGGTSMAIGYAAGFGGTSPSWTMIIGGLAMMGLSIHMAIKPRRKVAELLLLAFVVTVIGFWVIEGFSGEYYEEVEFYLLTLVAAGALAWPLLPQRTKPKGAGK